MIYGIAGASPHTRGWTPPLAERVALYHGFPAHAGMDPCAGTASGRRPGLPRTRGDGPLPQLRRVADDLASPHTRGWTRGVATAGEHERGFPAHAGMDPLEGAEMARIARLPRTRGDGPW